jgi:hypothetical protein
LTAAWLAVASVCRCSACSERLRLSEKPFVARW